MEVVVLDELVEVDREELEGDDQVIAEHAVVLDLDYVVLVVGVLLLQVLQDAQLNARLVLVTLFVLDDFYRDDFVGFVVQALESLAKTAFTQEIKHFEAVVDVILKNDIIVPILVIVSRVMQLGTGLSLYLISFETKEVDLLEVKQLSLLEIGQFASLCVQFEGLPHGHRVLNFFLWCVSRNVYLFGRLLLLINVCVLSVLAQPLRRLLLS